MLVHLTVRSEEGKPQPQPASELLPMTPSPGTLRSGACNVATPHGIDAISAWRYMILLIPAALLRRFYVGRSLQNVEDGFEFRLKNMVAPTTVISLGPVEVDGVPFASNQLLITASKPHPASVISERKPLQLPMGKEITIQIDAPPLTPGEHQLAVHAVTREVGAVVIDITEIV